MTTPSKLAVILHADVVGSTALVLRDEGLAHERIRDTFRRFSETISAYGGVTHELRGDALLAEFNRASDAIAASLSFQVGSTRNNEPLVDDIRPALRIGISLGEVVIADDTLTGPDVVLAQRIEQLAPPGGICVSAAVQQAVPRRLPFEFDDLGEQQVKGFDERVRAYSVTLRPGEDIPAPGPRARIGKTAGRESRRWAGAGVMAMVLVAAGITAWWQPWTPEFEPVAVDRMSFPLPDVPSIAVLPFDNFSNDPEQDYFADGMIDDLITDLSKVSGLFVIARNSTFTYKGRAVTVQQVAEDLGVRYVVEGSVRRSGDEVRINAQLIDTVKGNHVWAERYDGTVADIFDLQDKITRNIVTALSVALAPTRELPEPNQNRTDDPAAYDAVLLGWKYLRQPHKNPENYVLAREQFEKAMRLDPGYLRAYSSMAALYWWATRYGEHTRLGLTHQEGIDRAKAYLEIAMRSPSALDHRIRAHMYRKEGQFDRAIAEADRAVALDPNNAEGYIAKASAQVSAGQPTLALKNLDIADRLDPEQRNWAIRGIANLLLGTNEEAARILELEVAAEPKDDWLYPWLISTYGHLDRQAEADAAIKTLNELLLARDFGRYTREYAAGYVHTYLKADKDKEYFLLGLAKAGVEPGGDPNSIQRALDTIVSRTTNGHYEVEGVPKIGAKQAKTLLEQGVTMLDLRGIRSWRAGHVDGALHAEVIMGELTEGNLGKVVRKDQPVCFYCSGFT